MPRMTLAALANMPCKPLAYPVSVAAEIVGIPETVLVDLIARGIVPVRKISRSVVIATAQVEFLMSPRGRSQWQQFMSDRVDSILRNAAEAKRVARAKAVGTIYLIGDGEHTKIGFTTRPVEKRLAAIQTGHPKRLRVLATFQAVPITEAKLHKKFSHLRMSGEWFRHEAELADWAARGCPIISATRANIGNIRIQYKVAEAKA